MFLYLQLLVLVVLVYLDQYLGVSKEYITTVMWWDIPLHILGGLWLGFLFLYCAGLFRIKVHILHCILFACAIGAVWEVFEYVNHIGGSVFMSYRVDTVKDLADDMIGGALAGLCAQGIYWMQSWRK